MKQLVLRHHAEPDGSNPTITVIYQDPMTFQQETVGPFPFALDFSDESRERLRTVRDKQFALLDLAG